MKNCNIYMGQPHIFADAIYINIYHNKFYDD